MLLRMTQLAETPATSIVKNSLPKASMVMAASSTALHQSFSNNNEKHQYKMFSLAPRAKACVSMAAAMALHFGGYEFARSGALALFTSSEIGFSHPSAYPFAMGLVTPFSLSLLYWYGVMLKAKGPRYALRTTKFISVAILTFCTVSLKLVELNTSAPAAISKILVALLFVFQNSYAHLLYTQQWSLLGSVMTPSEGTRWFSAIAGLSSLVCTLTATLVHKMAPVIGILGLLLGTSFSLTLSLVLADYAYKVGENFGFDPTKDMKGEGKGGEDDKAKDDSLLRKTANLFQRVPTLAALFGEVVAFQSLSTVLNICFVRQLKEHMPVDTDRASFSGRFYAYINGTSGLMQFFILPLARKYLEPKWVYRVMPLLLLPWLIHSSLQASTLWISAAALFSLKTLDYSLRNVVNEMVYQPLDFESRYLGKEVIGVFANRFGKSGMSLILSVITAQFADIGVPQLSQLSVLVASIWTSCSFWLSKNVVTNKEAEQKVKQRQKKD